MVSRKAQYTDNRLKAMLRANWAPPLDNLLPFAPAEPLGPPEAGDMTWPPKGIAEPWSASIIARAEKYLGYQPGHAMREQMKYGPQFQSTPHSNAPLIAFVIARISHARAHWSREIDMGLTSEQFRDWLTGYLDFQCGAHCQPLWPDDPDEGWALSFQILRLACGLPRFHRRDPRSGKS